MLSAAQRTTFDSAGLLRLPGAIEVGNAQKMSAAIWGFLDGAHAVDRDDRLTWTTERPTGFRALARSGVLDGFWAERVCDVLAELLGPEEQQHRESVRVLMTFPQPEVWTIPTSGWHFDYTPLQPMAGIRATQVFALLSDVDARGGGTLVLTGSHRLVSHYVAQTGRDPKPRDVKRALGSAHPWLAGLWAGESAELAEERATRFLDRPVVLEGVDVRVTEMTGQAGDVFVMHSDCFHAINANARDTPRLMSTSLITRRPISAGTI